MGCVQVSAQHSVDIWTAFKRISVVSVCELDAKAWALSVCGMGVSAHRGTMWTVSA